MLDRIKFYLRGLFAIIWLVLSSILGFIIVAIRWGDPSGGHRFARLFRFNQHILGIKVVVHNPERMLTSQPCVYVANHQSDLDMVVFSSIYPPRCFLIGKKEIIKIPFFGIFFKASGNVLLDRADRDKAIAGMGTAAERMKNEGLSCWVFPEGTRNPHGPMRPFKKGAFHLATYTGVPIVPICCSPISRVVDVDNHRAPGGVVEVRILEPVPSEGLSVDELMARVRSAMEEVLESFSHEGR